MIALWLLLVVGCVVAGGITGTQSLEGADAGTGQSAKADHRLENAHLQDPAVESVLVRSDSAAKTRTVAAQIQGKVAKLKQVSDVRGPAQSPELSTAGGKTVLVNVTMRGDPEQASDHIDPITHAVDSIRTHQRGVTIDQSGNGTMNKAIDEIVGHDLQKAEVYSLPLTLILLILAFGALVAAAVPLLLGVTSVIAALGALGVVSQFAPMSDTASSLIVLIGLAVGVDYSLFYIRREREERRRGRGKEASLDIAAATVGRAVIVSGLTVLIALSGLIVTGLGVFTSMALATMVVVAIAMIGSLTVLPATLALLGDRVNRGRVPLLGKLLDRRARRDGGVARGAWARLAGLVTRRPAASLAASVCVLIAIAAPAVNLHTADQGGNELPKGEPVVVASHAIERAFPGSPDPAQLVVTGKALGQSGARARLDVLGKRARTVTKGKGETEIKVARDGRTARISVPMRDGGVKTNDAVVRSLRDDIAPKAGGVVPGARMLVTGSAAQDADFTQRLTDSTPLVIAFVLGLALLLLLAAFRSLALAASVMGLNLLSVLASYGVLVAVFQNSWAETLLDFTSNGTIANYLPLFMFVLLFGLSMDYTVLVLERIREGRQHGLSPREAASEGVGATGGTVTSAAIVMVAIFSLFAMLRLLEMKEMGVGMAVAVLLDATLVRGVALPALVAALGERGLKAPKRARRERHFETAGAVEREPELVG